MSNAPSSNGMASNLPNAPTSTQYAASAPPAANANATSLSLEEKLRRERLRQSVRTRG